MPEPIKDGQESYSIYPPTNSPHAPPTNIQYMYPYQYQYRYPVAMEMYTGQATPFMNYNMNPAMYYGTNIPSQGKKKHFHANNGNGQVGIGHVDNAKKDSNNSGYTTVKSTPVVIKNQYKFEIGNSNCASIENLDIEFPFYINTNAEEFANAHLKKQELTQELLHSESINSTKQNIKDTLSDTKVSLQSEEVLKPPKSQDELPHITKPQEDMSQSNKFTVSKSWSAVVSGGVNKGGVSSLQCSSVIKKDKKYIPSNMKGQEPLGSISLRIALDKDYLSHTAGNIPVSSFPINNIVPKGIINKGNICFMSSVLQVLLYCKPFMNLLNIVSLKTTTKMGASNSPLLDACLKFYKQFNKSAFDKDREKKGLNNQVKNNGSKTTNLISDSINPEEFYRQLSKLPTFKDLKWGHQEDAEEFLTHFLDQLHEEFIYSVNSLSSNDVMNLLHTINDDDLMFYFVKSLSKYKKADFLKNISGELKELIDRYGISTSDDHESEDNGWHEVSNTSKKGKKTKTAAKRTVEIEPSPIYAIFGGQFRSVLDIPQNKESQSITLDPFQTIQLDISDPQINSLETAFQKFSEFELLPFKSSSGSDVEAKKQTFIDKLPQILLVQLKRFQFVNNTNKQYELINYNAYNGRVEKIRKKIHYSHELIIPKETISSVNSKLDGMATSYKLIGVIYHHGISSTGGHYTCNIFNQESNKWFGIDDTNIQELNKDDVLQNTEDDSDTKTAYILIYEKE